MTKRDEPDQRRATRNERKIFRAVTTALSLFVLSFTCSGMPACGAGHSVAVVADERHRNHFGLVEACGDLVDALSSAGHHASVHWLDESAEPPAGDLILVGMTAVGGRGNWMPECPDGYRIKPVSLPGRKALAVEGDARGLARGPTQPCHCEVRAADRGNLFSGTGGRR